MKSKVYYFTARTRSHKDSLSKIKGPISLEKIGIREKVKKKDKVVIKTHFGALENTRYLRPSYIRFLCDFIKEIGGNPYVAESCGWGLPEEISGIHTEYSGRCNEQEYLNVAKQHGFTDETMGAPILMLDGPEGIDIIKQPVNGKRFKEVLVAGRLKEFDYLIMASHFKGHIGTGFGGAIKNLGIGCVSKGGKTQAHTGKTFNYNFEQCIAECSKCVDICPTGALKKENNKLMKDWERCCYCYMCQSICKDNIITLDESTNEDLIIQTIDNAKAVVDYFGKSNIFYINYALDITWKCDCGPSDTPFVPDIGILSSLDPVALDQACIDLIHKSPMVYNSILSEIKNIPSNNASEWFSYLPRINNDTNKLDYNEDGKINKTWELQLKLAEEIGLGSREYELINVKIDVDKK
ncbi:MAG: DUF362 domain-containing protein [Candidatus Lokiarchaeota archaeon]|nr:DUF362 domain-containing protein [Candidatus Lokiarchaeota archaeon]